MFTKQLKKAQHLISSGEINKAESICKKILKKAPHQIDALQLLGIIALNKQQFDKSIEFFNQVLQMNPNHAVSCYNIGIAYGNSGQVEPAVNYLKKAVELKPDMACAYRDLCMALKETDNTEFAVQAGRTATRLTPEDPAAHYNLAKALHEWRDFDESFKSYQRANSLSPDNPAIIYELAQIHQGRGETDLAKKYFRRVIELYPKEIESHRQLMRLSKYTDPNHDDIKKIQKFKNDMSLNPDERTSVMFMLSKAYADCDLYDKAFNYALKGNKIQDQILQFNADEFSDYISSLIAFYTPEHIRKLKQSGSSSSTPIFIIGTPRSGTTLVEQILCCHQNVFGAGELDWIMKCINALPHYLKSATNYPACTESMTKKAATELSSKYLRYITSLASGEPRITDKMPGNFLHLGFIHILFPSAKIIHCQREPRDACISMFLEYFPGVVSYSYDLYKLGAYYSQYLRLMKHWRSVLPEGTMLDVKYESIVQNQETETHQLLDFLQLEWDKACLDFHKKKRRVFTASHLQVSKPLYSSSMQRWKKYEKHLQPLEDGFNYQPPTGDTLNKS